ncbi:MAG: isocitrate lyase/phosphoenolpyruvate mutase family protein [Hyphomonadaceae bacterium]|nr:isocitrate lyase/phosphoenolpyruvate mutase family protein [Hyphomonadaceae bacterium]
MTVSFKRRIAEPRAILAPGAYDALSALLVEQAGFESVYISGASVAYTQLGRPDVGLITATHIADVVSRVRDRVSLPMIVDIDTGFGNAINVQQIVRQMERLGANALQIEDQTSPKRCGHLQGKDLISAEEMAGKVKAAVDARTSEDTIIIARTDAVAVEGFERALERAALYRDAGADVLFVEALQSLDEMRAVCRAFGADTPLLANMVEGGKTPILTKDQLEEMGFRIVISPGSMVRALAFMAQEFLRLLHANGTTALYRDRMLDFAQINALIGLPDLLADGARYEKRGREAAE